MNDFFAFRKMITPVIIQIVFWIGVVVCVIGGLVSIVQGDVAGIFMMLIGPVVVRIYCELIIVAFRMLDTMQKIEKNTAGEATPPAEGQF
jgi:Domain of unknown function (DUF4282)